MITTHSAAEVRLVTVDPTHHFQHDHHGPEDEIYPFIPIGPVLVYGQLNAHGPWGSYVFFR